MERKKFINIFLATMLIFIMHTPFSSIAQPYWAYDNYFTYLKRDATNLPPGAIAVSKSTFGISYSGYSLGPGERSGTGFFIRTFRSDGKICACTAGHIVEEMYNITSLPDMARWVSFRAFMNFLGRATPDGRNQTLSYSLSNVNAEVVRWFFSEEPDGVPDIALLLVDKAQLSSEEYAELPLDFDNLDNDTASTFYYVAHPNGMTQRIAKDQKQNAHETNYIYTNAISPGSNMAIGSSGAASVRVKTDGSWSAVGALSANQNEDTIPQRYPDGVYTYSSELLFSKITALRAAIEEHCWQTKSKEQLMQSGEYKQALVVDNSVGRAEFNPLRSLTSMGELKAAANAGFGAGNPKSVLIKGSEVNVSHAIAFDEEVKHVFISSGIVNLNAGFSCNPGADNVFYASPAVLQATSSSLISSAGLPVPVPAADGFSNQLAGGENLKIYPNPSATGQFNLQIPVTKKNLHGYRIEVRSINGSQVLQPRHALSGTCQFELKGHARGMYVMNVYDEDRKEIVFSKTIVY